jgi:SAM-dependent methyltransferase
MFKKYKDKLANSIRKRMRKAQIFFDTRGLIDQKKINTTRSISPIKIADNIETVIPYGEKYFENQYGDMHKARKRDSKVIYDVYEYYLMVDSLLKYLNLRDSLSSVKILEAGCNNGYTVMMLRQVGIEAYGVDVNKYALSVASDFVKPYLSYGSFAEIPYADNSFDITVSWGTIEHLPEELSSKCLSEAIRVSRKAIWIGCDNVPASIEPTHVTNYPIEWWEQKLEALGQKVDNKLRETIKNHPILLKRRFYPPALECVLNKK